MAWQTPLVTGRRNAGAVPKGAGDQARGVALAGREHCSRHCRHPAGRAKSSPRLPLRRSQHCKKPACFSSSCRRRWGERKPIQSPKCWCWRQSHITTSPVAGALWLAPPAVGSLGAFLPQAGLDRVFANGHIPTASISFFPAGRAVRENGGYRISGRWRFNSGIRHSEWVLGGTVVEGTES